MTTDMAVPSPIRVVLIALVAWLVGFEASALLPSHPLGATLFGGWATAGVQLAAAALVGLRGARLAGRERLAWSLIAAGIVVWTLGDVYWLTILAGVDVPPVPSGADLLYLAFVPLVFAGLLLLMHARIRYVPRTVAVDGVIVALAAAVVAAAAVVQPVARAAQGDTLAVVTNVAYPVLDLMLLGLILVAVALRGWRPDRTWLLLGAGTLAFWLADSLYLVATADGTYTTPSAYDVGWVGSTVLYALAAWQPKSVSLARERTRGAREIALPLALAFAALVVTVLQPPTAAHAATLALGLSCMLAVMLRLGLTFRENVAMLDASHRLALTDALTGLGNRRALTVELDAAFVPAGGASARTLVLFDLDGFKHYNDSFGHPAGDALLMRLGRNLARAVADGGQAFRMGGDEFCVLLRGDADATAPLVAAAAVALSDRGEGFAIGCSHGAIALPREAGDPETALRIADQRMYAAKDGGRPSAGRQSKDVLLRALSERDPELGSHLADVARLAEEVARRVGLEPEAVEHVRHAAELHDIGKVAIPDAILHKEGPLDDAEWTFIHNHTLIGERIIAAAPALGPVAALVRSSHERFDGGGYPDALNGAAIPFGARIVAICDAFDAMVTDRAYRPAMSSVEALAELRRCAGTQFDPEVVEAFCAMWAARTAPVS